MKKLITDEYKNLLNEEMKKKNFGGESTALGFKYFIPWMQKLGVKDVLDYGCGSGFFKEYKGDEFNIIEYDPARDDVSELPKPCDFVVCRDVLEHVEPELIFNVLDDLKRVISKNAFISISLIEAHRILSDGRNAHILLKQPPWWINEVEKRFKIYKYHFEVNIHTKKIQNIDFYLSSTEYDSDDEKYI